MKTNLEISISRMNTTPVKFLLSVIDENTWIKVIEAELSAENLSKIITGLGVFVEADVNTEFVGKRKVKEDRQYRTKTSERVDIAKEIHGVHEGTEWNFGGYLNSKNSVIFDHTTGDYVVNYSVYKYE